MDINAQFTHARRTIDLTPLNQIIPKIASPEIRLTGNAATQIAQFVGVKNPTALAYVKLAFDNPKALEKVVQSQINQAVAPYTKQIELANKVVNDPAILTKVLSVYLTTFLRSLIPDPKGKQVSATIAHIKRADTVIAATKDAMQLALGAAITAKELGRDPIFAAASMLTLITGESKGNPEARNPTTNAYGLIQILPSTWKDITGSQAYRNTMDILDRSGYNRILSNYLNIPHHVLSNPATTIDKKTHYAEQIPVAIAHYNMLHNRVNALFKYEQGQWRPGPGVNLDQWRKFTKLCRYTDNYYTGKQALITALHINGLNCFTKDVNFAHAGRINSDAAVFGYMIVNPVFRSSFNQILEAFNAGSSSSIIKSLSGDPFIGLTMVSPYNKRRKIKIAGVMHDHIHKGVDIKAAGGTVLYAPFNGFITQSNFSDTAGYLLKINSEQSGDSIVLMHLAKKGAAKGPVCEGDIIGYVGSTGLSQKPHIHLEYFTKFGRRIDPANAPYQWIKLIKKIPTV